MRKWIAALLISATCGILPAMAQQDTPGSFRVLSYHDVRDEPAAVPDRYTVSTRNLVRHFSWLREQGYKVVSIDDVLAAHAGRQPLPPKAVLLTFDDGYRSVYTHVFPLLKAYNYPAVIALVGKWLEVEPGAPVHHENQDMNRANFLQWSEIREMAASGLVEIASHTYNLHQGIAGNPQGDRLPAGIARHYVSGDGRYEDDQQYQQRVRADLTKNSDYIERHLGKRPRVMVWPYGRYNGNSAALAREAGMPIAFTLEPGPNTSAVPPDRWRRDLVVLNPDISELASVLTVPDRSPGVRVMHVDLDYVYDPDPAAQRNNIGQLLDRVRSMGINTVFLQAYADPDGNGAADALYFPNRHLPMRADLFSHVAWQLHVRAGVNVYAWMPVLAFELPAESPAVDRVEQSAAGRTAAGYPRLSPYDPRARALIRNIYEDLARHAVFQGLLFHDDATLSDHEDASKSAIRHYSAVWKLPESLEEIRSDPARFADWSRRKSLHLTQFTLELARVVAPFQQHLKTARNLYARVALEPESETWFGQNVADFLASYDYTAIMAMPYLDGADDAVPWLRHLVAEMSRQPMALQRSIFELQSTDWRNGLPVNSTLMAEKMRQLQLAGALNFGYYPDDFVRGHPDMQTLKPMFSLETFPYARGGRSP